MKKFITLILIIKCFSLSLAENPDSVHSDIESKFEPLPIFYYDSNDGFGYGVKAFFLNFLHQRESYDVLLARSTKGFQKYTLVFSIPDFEMRQGTIYPFSMDIVLDFKKWIAYKFYGIGNNTKFKDEELYTRERPSVSLIASRGFSKTFVGQLGVKYTDIRNFRFDEEGRLQNYSGLNVSRVYYYSIYLSARYDTRDSFIHPSAGFVLQGENEYANGNVTFNRSALWIQHYTNFWNSKLILASRFGMQTLSGDNLPIQVLLPIGGDDTIRGYSQDRFIDKTSAVANIEIRFPFFWRFGGIIGIDAGKVWNSLYQFNFKNWPYNLAIGGRFYFDTFVVRADMGISKETTGIYLNFAHIF
jgi:outer membrane protein assembly factor BamA